MRLVTIFALAAVASLMFPLAASDEGKARDALAITLVGSSPGAMIITWTPAPGAIGYTIYRGASLESLQAIGTSATTAFVDTTSPSSDVWYVVLSNHPAFGTDNFFEQSRGQCFHASTSGVSIWAANCLPVRPL